MAEAPWLSAVLFCLRLAGGFLTPLLRSLLLSMPPLMPTALAMAFELACYSGVAGPLYRKLPRMTLSIYIALVAVMLAGRVDWVLVCTPLFLAVGSAFSWGLFFTGAFVKVLPGIICHIVLIPLIVLAMRRAKLMA